MNTLFLDTFGVMLRVQGSRLVVEDKRKRQVIEEISPEANPYSMVVVNGHDGCINFEAVRWFVANGHCPILWLTWTGAPLALTIPWIDQSLGALKVTQLKAYLDEKQRLAIAKEFVRSKVATEKALLHSFNQNLDFPLFHDISKVQSISELLIYEAQAGDEYYKKIIPEFGTKLSYHRVRDGKHQGDKSEIGAMLNYANGILTGFCRAAITNV